MGDPHPLPGIDVVVDGVRLHVVDYGRGAAEPGVTSKSPADAAPGEAPLVLLRGPWTPESFWDDVVRDLGREHRVLVPDPVGLGESEAPTRPHPYQPNAQASRLRALIDAWGIDRFTVVGHDLGGTIAVHLAALAPGRVRGLVLVSAPLHQDVMPARATLSQLVSRLRRPACGTVPHDRSRGRRAFLRAVDLTSAERLLDVVADVPALVLWGQNDDVWPVAYGRRLAESLGAAWVPVNGAGHLLPSERPERVAEELHAFAGAGSEAL